MDTTGRRFGGNSTHNWAYSQIGCSYARDPGSFIFNLSDLIPSKKFFFLHIYLIIKNKFMTEARIISEIKDIYNDPPDYISA